MMPYFIYILECSNGSFYTGYAKDLVKRYQQHLKGSAGAKFTRSFPPVRIAAYWVIHCNLSYILKIENFIKNLSRAMKIKLILNPHNLVNFLAQKHYDASILKYSNLSRSVIMSQSEPKKISWLSPYITVKDVAAAADFYHKAFKFEVMELAPGEDGTPCHGELNYKDQLIMIGKEGAWQGTTKTPLTSQVESPITLYLYCENVDDFYNFAISANAKSIAPPEDMFWGDRMCRLQDLDGYIWCFATTKQNKN
jgi:PhnB protein